MNTKHDINNEINLALWKREIGLISRENYWEVVSENLVKVEKLAKLCRMHDVNLQITPDNLMVDISCSSNSKERLKMVLNPRDVRSVPFSSIADGKYEPFQSDLLVELGNISKSFLDIGANVGFYSIALKLENPNLEVHAFEPQPDVFQTLVLNSDLNQLTGKINLNNCGLGLKESTEKMFRPAKSGTTGASLKDLHPEEGKPIEMLVEIKTVDKLFESRKDIDLMKIDVEGFEFEVVNGALECISESHPTIMIELLRKWMRPFGHEPQEIVEILVNLGYEAFSISDQGIAAIKKIDEETKETNFLFIHGSNKAHIESALKFKINP